TLRRSTPWAGGDRLAGSGETGRAGADDDDPARRSDELGWPERPLPARTGVLGAGDRCARVVVGDAHVAADAPEHLRRPPLGRLPGQVRVGDERTRHAERVGDPAPEEAVGLARIDDAGGGPGPPFVAGAFSFLKRSKRSCSGLAPTKAQTHLRRFNPQHSKA